MIRRQRRKIGDDENTDRWLLTYADLITLLLAFFVVLYSMSQIDIRKFDAVSDALAGVMKLRRPMPPQLNQVRVGDAFQGGPVKLGTLNMIHAELEQQIVDRGLDDKLSLESTERGLVIHVTESALFQEAKAELDDPAKNVLNMIGEKLKGLENEIQVEGHTDNRPINTPKFPSNWELSAARSLSVVHYFINQHKIPPHQLSAAGYGEFRPVAPNRSPDGMARNRRVDIVVLNQEYSSLQPRSADLGTAGSFGW